MQIGHQAVYIIGTYNESGKVDVAKLQPITYDPMKHHYWVLGEKSARYSMTA